jgi:hypothetical protein
MAATSGNSGFGSCCESMNETINSKDFDPLVEVGEDGVLYMSIGLVGGDDENDEPSMIDHPVFFCPFCGTRVQTAEEVDKKTGQTS